MPRKFEYVGEAFPLGDAEKDRRPVEFDACTSERVAASHPHVKAVRDIPFSTLVSSKAASIRCCDLLAREQAGSGQIRWTRTLS